MPSDDLHAVTKLNSKLIQMSEHGVSEDQLIKIMHRLETITMTLKILEETHIGRTVNGLRKLGGEVGALAKTLVKRWKKVLPDASHHPGNRHPDRVGGQRSLAETASQAAAHGMEATASARAADRTKHSSLSGRKDLSKHGRIEQKRATDNPPTRTVIGSLEDSSPANTRTSRKGVPTNSSRDVSVASGDSTNYLSTPRPTHRSSHSASPAPPSGMGDRTDASGSLRSSHSVSPTPPRSHDQSGGRKRRGVVLDTASIDVAMTRAKRSRTAVYSGMKPPGQTAIPSLFDKCLEVLKLNIDAIEEVGGVPYFILKPVLQKCNPTQLMRLEEFNPHFLDESQELWEKHCQREFYGYRPTKGQTWREFFVEKLAQREEKIRTITEAIRARQKEREEPVIKTILSEPPPSLNRRRRGQPSSYPSRGGPLEKNPITKPLMKQTMQMARHRQRMMSSHPGRRH